MTRRLTVALTVAGFTLLGPSLAFAQGKAATKAQPRGASAAAPSTSENPVYVFEDEALLGGGLDGNLAVIKVRPNAARVTLIRPRTTFVPEMLKSVENI